MSAFHNQTTPEDEDCSKLKDAHKLEKWGDVRRGGC